MQTRGQKRLSDGLEADASETPNASRRKRPSFGPVPEPAPGFKTPYMYRYHATDGDFTRNTCSTDMSPGSASGQMSPNFDAQLQAVVDPLLSASAAMNSDDVFAPTTTNYTLYTNHPAPVLAISSPLSAPQTSTKVSAPHRTAAISPVMRGQHSRSRGLAWAGYSLAQAGLALPLLDTKKLEELTENMAMELARQRSNPPAIPRSTIPDLPPKEYMGSYQEVPDDPVLAEDITKANCRLANSIKDDEKSRNNMAARKSRLKREEKIKRSMELNATLFCQLN